tara:strand:- start:286 stop:738 length:453 start_codon:yes stop_codon:yes gene_type:complete
MKDRNGKDIHFDISKVYLKFSDIHGRGVFAKHPIDLGDTIEVFPLTPCAFRTHYQGDPTIMHYAWVRDNCPCDECKKHGFQMYLSSGYANMYNHQEPDKCNARIEIEHKDLYGKVIANKTIKIDEEIVIYYGPNFSFPKGEVINHENSPR